MIVELVNLLFDAGISLHHPPVRPTDKRAGPTLPSAPQPEEQP